MYSNERVRPIVGVGDCDGQKGLHNIIANWYQSNAQVTRKVVWLAFSSRLGWTDSWAGLRPRLARLTEVAEETLVLPAHPATIRGHQEDVTVTTMIKSQTVALVSLALLIGASGLAWWLVFAVAQEDEVSAAATPTLVPPTPCHRGGGDGDSGPNAQSHGGCHDPTPTPTRCGNCGGDPDSGPTRQG